MTIQHGKLHHKTPGWVPSGARFHIRIRLEGNQRPLTDPSEAPRLLESANFYHQQNRWYLWLLVLMPDHLHGIFTFPQSASMSRTVGEWKKYQTQALNIIWQEGFFDHRIRNDDEFIEKSHYIKMNPGRSGLCASPADWPWILEPWRE
jgi:REP element-mobilizing transposase RayT